MSKEREEVLVIGKVRLNGQHAPCLEVVLDTASGRSDGEIVLLRQVSTQDNPYYTKKVS